MFVRNRKMPAGAEKSARPGHGATRWPSRNTRKKLSSLRVAVMASLMLSACGSALVCVRFLPRSWVGSVTAGLMGVVVLLIAASFIEWLVHRLIYHRRWIPFLRRIYHIHHVGHHHVIFPTWRYVTGGGVRRHPILSSSVSTLHSSEWNNSLIKLAHFAFYMILGGIFVWTPAWLLTRNVAFLGGMVFASVVVSDLFVRVHDAIHYPGVHPFIEAQPWFRFLENHHYIHHVDMEANVNFLLPLSDWLFGSLRRTLTAEELAKHGPLEEAKKHRVGMSEPAREVAKPRSVRQSTG